MQKKIKKAWRNWFFHFLLSLIDLSLFFCFYYSHHFIIIPISFFTTILIHNLILYHNFLLVSFNFDNNPINCFTQVSLFPIFFLIFLILDSWFLKLLKYFWFCCFFESIIIWIFMINNFFCLLFFGIEKGSHSDNISFCNFININSINWRIPFWFRYWDY